jgi:hypothetical protein
VLVENNLIVLENKMAEFRIYERTKKLYDQITSGNRKDYVITTQIPPGVNVSLGLPPSDDRSFLKRLFFERDWGPIVCIGLTDRATYLLAVRTK